MHSQKHFILSQTILIQSPKNFLSSFYFFLILNNLGNVDCFLIFSIFFLFNLFFIPNHNYFNLNSN